MKNQIDEATKQERYHRLMALQAKISEEIQQEREGKVLTVLVEGHDEKKSGPCCGAVLCGSS